MERLQKHFYGVIDEPFLDDLVPNTPVIED